MTEPRKTGDETSRDELKLESLEPKHLTPEQESKVKGGLSSLSRPETPGSLN